MYKFSWFNHVYYVIKVFYMKSWNICAYFVHGKSKKEFNHTRFVDPNILCVYYVYAKSKKDLRISIIVSFLLAVQCCVGRECC